MDGVLLNIYFSVKAIGYSGAKYHILVNNRVLSQEGLDPLPKDVYRRIGDIYYNAAVSIQTQLVSILGMKDRVRFLPKIRYSSDPFKKVIAATFFENVVWFTFMRSVENYPSDWQSALLIGQFHESVQQYALTLEKLAIEITTLIEKGCPYLSADEIAFILNSEIEPSF